MKKTDRDELRKDYKLIMDRWDEPCRTEQVNHTFRQIPKLLDALDEAEQTIQTLRELAPQPAPRDSEGKWQ